MKAEDVAAIVSDIEEAAGHALALPANGIMSHHVLAIRQKLDKALLAMAQLAAQTDGTAMPYEMPEIEAGDWVWLKHAYGPDIVTKGRLTPGSGYYTPGEFDPQQVNEVRKANGVIWRRPSTTSFRSLEVEPTRAVIFNWRTRDATR